MMVKPTRENLCRLICSIRNINPDVEVSPITEETENRLGKQYKLWQYQQDIVDKILVELEIEID